MACKLCNKSLFYETSWVVPDGGYGDNDYGGVNIHQVVIRICPHCGEIKVNSNLSENEKEEFVIGMLANILSNNVKHTKNIENFEEKLSSRVQDILKLGTNKYYEKVIKQNDLKFENGKLLCSCGEEIGKAVSIKQALEDLKVSKVNYCFSCGKKLKELKMNVEEQDEPWDFVVETKETWNRGRD